MARTVLLQRLVLLVAVTKILTVKAGISIHPARLSCWPACHACQLTCQSCFAELDFLLTNIP
jgi:hypothetical protein